VGALPRDYDELLRAIATADDTLAKLTAYHAAELDHASAA
jgi:hypothetical protein